MYFQSETLNDFVQYVDEQKAEQKHEKLSVPPSFLLRISYPIPEVLTKLVAALSSGHCPSGTIEFESSNPEIGNLVASSIAQALLNGKCPKDLKIKFSSIIGDIGLQALANALSSGYCPEGLSLNLNIGMPRRDVFGPVLNALDVGFNYIPLFQSDSGMQPLFNALLSSKCPSRLKIKTTNMVIYEDMALLKIALESGNCPNGLSLSLTIDFAGIASILIALQSGNCPEDLSLNFNGVWTAEEKISIGLEVARVLKSGKAPKGLKLRFINFSNTLIPAIAEALSTGLCPAGLQINISGSQIEPLAHALQSGRCPNDLQINFHVNDEMDLQMLANAIESKQCPQGLKLKFIILTTNGLWAGDETDFLPLINAMQSGNAPIGLSLDLSNCYLTYNDFTAIANAINSGNYPNDLHLDISGNYLDKPTVDYYDSESEEKSEVEEEYDNREMQIIQALKNISAKQSAQQKIWPSGLKIIFDKPPHYNSESPNNESQLKIDHLLKNIDEQQAVFACLSLLQGYRQGNNKIAQLPFAIIHNLIIPYLQVREEKNRDAFIANLYPKLGLLNHQSLKRSADETIEEKDYPVKHHKKN